MKHVLLKNEVYKPVAPLFKAVGNLYYVKPGFDEFWEWSHWTLQPSQVCLSYIFHNIEMRPTFLPSKKANVVLSI